MSAVPSDRDEGYDPRSKGVRRLIDQLVSEGHEIGFHPGYYTWNNPEVFCVEKDRFEQLGFPRNGGRQHYLRFDAASTWRIWNSHGMRYDSTLGYAEHIGFRAGTCHPFHPFNLVDDTRLDLLEIPLIVMDGTLFGYQKLDCSEAELAIEKVAKRCQEVNGIFTLLWHNTYLTSATANEASLYRRIAKTLSGMVDR
jgi:hypothetical protein